MWNRCKISYVDINEFGGNDVGKVDGDSILLTSYPRFSLWPNLLNDSYQQLLSADNGINIKDSLSL